MEKGNTQEEVGEDGSGVPVIPSPILRAQRERMVPPFLRAPTRLFFVTCVVVILVGISCDFLCRTRTNSDK